MSEYAEDYNNVWTVEDFHEQSDVHFSQGVGFAIARAGLEEANKLARLMNIEPHPTDVVKTTQKIMMMFNQMSIELHLMSTDEFMCVIKLTTQVPNGETIQ